VTSGPRPCPPLWPQPADELAFTPVEVNEIYCLPGLSMLQQSMTITYNTLIPRGAVNTASISVRVTEKGEGEQKAS